MVRIVAGVACCDPLGAQRATINGEAQRGAQHPAQRPQALSNEPVAIHAQRVAQQERNGGETTGVPGTERVLRAGGALAGAESRYSRAIAHLAAFPVERVAVIAEAGDPAVIAVVVRDVAYGEIEIPAGRYDPIELLALMDRYATANRQVSGGPEVPIATLTKGFR